ncbi:MAG: phage holin family protein [Candidatus Gastranaerophilales bacterium]|nr:phage holin family protein [Candidatus Gastranaerophilales bacterium]
MFAMLLKWIGLALSIMFVGWIIPGITVSNFVTALIAGAAIALVNLVIKPALLFLTLPINILTLGLSILVINALLFMFVAYLVPGIEINGFWSAFLGALVLSILSIGLAWI